MDGRRRLFSSNDSALQNPPCSHGSHDGSAKLWHSTPVKKADGGSPLDAKQPSGLTRGKLGGFSSQWVQSDAADPCSAHHVQDAELPVKDLSVSTLQRQRKELQLLMAELKDRERELNAMSASHHKQHQAWEQDRHTMVMLERRCAGLEEELQSRNEVIRVLTKHVGVVESREKVMEKELGEAKQLICELEKKQQHINEKCQDYEQPLQMPQIAR
ncbi:PREDICTED: coiled-coil domain-containing protein 62 [Cyprinodon variegatus]|uniref:coiled-coil domain-containing protein 62 n=1 Tax=Cyprinodon variegatus TaxID=28743 RepID=UPI0007429783|nr:PREDICTED: coiled-coil domain-containing protein 62 [Cyprinodon variegatus]